MNIDNLALVRATNVIPFDGVMKPISETCYLNKNYNLEFSRAIRDMLTEEGIVPAFDFSKFGDEEYIDSYNKTVSNIVGDYIPYNSDYNSMILFSINGLVPDDSEVSFGNNTFSNKKCAVIDSLSSHIDQVISLVPTDTAVKGSIKLSNDAIVLIEKNYFLSLPDDIKNQLFNNSFTVNLFEGNLKDAVKDTLKKTGKYIPEELTLSRASGGYKESKTKAMTLDTINKIANSYNIAQVLHFDVLTANNDQLDKLQDVKDEYNHVIEVTEYYQTLFFNYLFSVMPGDEHLKNSVLRNPNSPVYLKKLCEMIKSFGIENYKNITMKYNSELELKQRTGELLTPDEIVNNMSISKTK